MSPGPKCTVKVLLEQLNEHDAAAVKAALADPRTAAADLSAVLRNNGFRIMPQTIRRHRNDLCSCSAREQAPDFAKAGSIAGALALLNKGESE